jgi:hypothetical protein
MALVFHLLVSDLWQWNLCVTLKYGADVISELYSGLSLLTKKVQSVVGQFKYPGHRAAK